MGKAQVKPGTVIQLLKDLTPESGDVAKGLLKGTLGVVVDIDNDPTTWGIKGLIVDFGARNSIIWKTVINDLTTIQIYSLPKRDKSINAKL